MISIFIVFLKAILWRDFIKWNYLKPVVACSCVCQIVLHTLYCTVFLYCLNCSVILARVLLLEITLNTKKFIFVGSVTTTI